MNTATITEQQGTLLVSGELNTETVSDLFSQGIALLTGKQRVLIDLESVERCDSAGLALLTEWLRFAKTNHIEIEYLHMPAQMLAIAKVSGLDKVLPMKSAVSYG